MNSARDVTYRLDLAKGFLEEAEQDLGLKRWRSAVNNAQLAVENAGKAVLALFGAAPKTHEPSRDLSSLMRTRNLQEDVLEKMRRILPDLLALGLPEHFLTDYGDEETYTLPWDLFDEASALEAAEAARRAFQLAKEIAGLVRNGDREG